MFDLVADVERYPEFVPLCRDLKVRRRTLGDDGVEVVIADMTVAYKLVRESFRSRVMLNRPKLEIAIEALVETTVRGRTAGSRTGGQGQEQQYIANLCDGRLQSLDIAFDKARPAAHLLTDS